ncbi:MAG: cytochrome bd-I oxidase subunit CydX [Rhodanobacter sp.]
MWYFSWMLGLGLACAFAILNAMWYEVRATDAAAQQGNSDDGDPL